MNAGLSNLTTLKAHVLAQPVRAETTFDSALLAIGLGAAAALEGFCGRQFSRVVGVTWDEAGDRLVYVLPRYPVESITSIEVRDGPGGAWTAQVVNDVVARFDAASGTIEMHTALGGRISQIRFTWSGGLWWETAEPGDVGYPTSQPVGSTALPDALRLAWLLQCQEIWSRRDNLGTGITLGPTDRAKLTELELIPAARDMVRPFVRYA